MSSVTLLGPQRRRPQIHQALEELGIRGSVAAITAGWQEREAEDDELYEHLGRRSFNLRLYHRTLVVMSQDPDLSRTLHERQAKLRDLQHLYRVRLNHSMDAVKELLELHGKRSGLVPAALEDALESVRKLDMDHLKRISEIHAEYNNHLRPFERKGLMLERKDLAHRLGSASAIAIAGGHVAILLNRLRLFDIASLIDGKPVIAWSAGAMALGERIVLFHDSPPQGPGYAEVMERGLGLYPDVVPLPHAKRRLRLEDPIRAALLSRRFSPRICVPMDEGDRVYWTAETGWSAPEGVRRLSEKGALLEFQT